MPNTKVLFPTGASTGFGRAMTELVLKNGGAVLATLRKPEVLASLSAQYPADHLLVLKLDLEKKRAVKFFREVNEPSIGGRRLQMSPMMGIKSASVLEFYNATKFGQPANNIKVTILEPDFFVTESHSHVLSIDSLPVYTNAPAVLSRSAISALQQNAMGPDPRKAAEAFYRLANLPNPPLHFLIGKDAIEAAKRSVGSFLAEMGTYTSWSPGLEFTD
ncbi:hypothetical protein OBBRIDRAFT_831200 [Obba rivulosa]|uniref:Uncharacterized protein n=1 Tax=Obba rivulosa TaxID=1052685 RepID=A0A8E2DSZ3_9APHY|nr:hypothetical protein OBBRIDRAFT_831200 [Obba rivulosa]